VLFTPPSSIRDPTTDGPDAEQELHNKRVSQPEQVSIVAAAINRC